MIPRLSVPPRAPLVPDGAGAPDEPQPASAILAVRTAAATAATRVVNFIVSTPWTSSIRRLHPTAGAVTDPRRAVRWCELSTVVAVLKMTVLEIPPNCNRLPQPIAKCVALLARARACPAIPRGGRADSYLAAVLAPAHRARRRREPHQRPRHGCRSAARAGRLAPPSAARRLTGSRASEFTWARRAAPRTT